MTGWRICAVAVVSLLASVASAHPPNELGHHVDMSHVHGTVRNWTNAKTGEVVQGAFLAVRSVGGVTMVSIERENGDVVVFAIEDLGADDQAEARRRIDEIKLINEHHVVQHVEVPQPAAEGAPSQAAAFNMFAPHVSTRWDDRWLYVESDGLPHLPGNHEEPNHFLFSHPLMIGITAWQQQVPLPQNYRGTNSWQIPLKPELADTPVSAKEQLFRGAIALAANGVPIFNPIKNDGRTDTLVAGELDEFGGHCGRADDYHYHIAPTHLQQFVGDGQPIAYALDGFPIYGLFDPADGAGSEHACPLGSHDPLDDLNGHFAPPEDDAESGSNGLYHYHASEHYPYLNGGMRGKVTVRDDQIEPQPRATPVRDWLQPLRGAAITGFKDATVKGEAAWSLEYAVSGEKGFVNYRIEGEWPESKYFFDFIAPDGTTRSDVYQAAGRGQGERRGRDRELAEANVRQGGERPRGGAQRSNVPLPSDNSFTLTSPDVVDGRLSIDCTCDGDGRVPALQWEGPPIGTVSFAAVMHHTPPGGEAHVYMVVTNLPASAKGLIAGAQAESVWGQNTVNRRAEYAPPCSQGAGDKPYSITLYALSSKVEAADGGFTRDALLAAIDGMTLATATLDVAYSRQMQDREQGGQPQAAEPRGQDRGERRGDRAGQAGREQGREQPGLLARMTAFKTDVPAHDMNVILARPTGRSILVTVALGESGQEGDAVVEYLRKGSGEWQHSDTAPLNAGEIAKIQLTDLVPGTEYRYRVGVRHSGVDDDDQPAWYQESRFRTRPGAGVPFAFVIQADSHLDQGVEPKVYEQTLANMLAGEPDFVVDLGDTFMTDKRGENFTAALPQYDAQRYYFSRLAHSAPLFMVLGNHDGELGTSGQRPTDIGPWAYAQRTSRFPEPIIDVAMYSGSTSLNQGVGSNYYAFEWGDALFVVLDPFWSTTGRIRGGGGGDRGGDDPRGEPLTATDASWATTLGRTQFEWLSETLESTTASYRFVFIHHLVGGKGGSASRGGVESSTFFEWGGNNADSTRGFAQHRPDWPMPIHDLLVKHKVSAVFHGHDHLYVHSERDGIHYQCVPQPGNLAGNTRTATEYGYTSGTILGSPGHVRVKVTPDAATVEFIRTTIADAVDGPQRRRRGAEAREDREENGAVVDSYVLLPVPTFGDRP